MCEVLIVLAYIETAQYIKGISILWVSNQAVPYDDLVEMELEVIVMKNILKDGVSKDMRSIKESIVEPI